MKHHRYIAKAWSSSNSLLAARMRGDKRAEEYHYIWTLNHLEKAISELSKPQNETEQIPASHRIRKAR